MDVPELNVRKKSDQQRVRVDGEAGVVSRTAGPVSLRGVYMCGIPGAYHISGLTYHYDSSPSHLDVKCCGKSTATLKQKGEQF